MLIKSLLKFGYSWEVEWFGACGLKELRTFQKIRPILTINYDTWYWMGQWFMVGLNGRWFSSWLIGYLMDGEREY
jgi:hypothetical protein